MPASIHKFGDFELEPARFELRRGGRVLKLERIPLELLILLVEKDGDVATRQEIIERLWGKDVFVDTEHGINTAIRKIRSALREDVDRPRFLQTVTGKGYRFVGEKNGHPPDSPALPQPTPTEPRQPIDIQPLQPVPVDPPQIMWGQPPRLSGGADSSRRSAATANPPATSRPLALILTLTLLLILALLLFLFRHRLFPTPAAQIHSIAVIPLANLSGDPSQDYFADGMTDEIITALAKNTPLRVVSRTSAMHYKGVNRPLPEIAKELRVDGIIEGSIARSPNHVHMTVQLIYAPTDSHVWAESYDRDSAQAVSIPAELSETIARQVRIATSPPKPARYINPEAHDAYLHGRYYWFSDCRSRCLEYFEKAVELQPDYAAAWSGLADTYGGSAIDGELPLQKVFSKWEAATRKAVELDDSLAEGHNTLAAFYFFGKWDLDRAEAESTRAISLDPNYAEARHLHSYILAVAHHPDEAVQEQKRGMEIAPFERPWALGRTYLLLRRFDAAITELRLRSDAQPTDTYTHILLYDAYRFKGRSKEAVEQLQQAVLLDGDKSGSATVGQVFQQGGSRALNEWMLHVARTKRRHGYFSPFWRARITARAGHKEDTLRLLEDADREHSPRLILLQNEADFDFLHSDPRYQAIVKKMGLQPAN